MTDWQQRNQQTTQRAIRLISRVPFSRMIALTGSIAEDRETEKSDIDFFVQVEKNHIFLTRFIITIILQLAGIRRTDTSITGKICLNWFATYNAPQSQKGRVYKILWDEPKASGMKRILENLFSSYMGKVIEKITKKYQISRIKRDPRTYLPGSMVRYSDTELGFHPPKK